MLKRIGKNVVSIPAVAGLAIGNAFAAVPSDVITAMSDMKADGVTVATGFLVATIVLAAFLFMRRGAK